MLTVPWDIFLCRLPFSVCVQGISSTRDSVRFFLLSLLLYFEQNCLKFRGISQNSVIFHSKNAAEFRGIPCIFHQKFCHPTEVKKTLPWTPYLWDNLSMLLLWLTLHTWSLRMSCCEKACARWKQFSILRDWQTGPSFVHVHIVHGEIRFASPATVKTQHINRRQRQSYIYSSRILCLSSCLSSCHIPVVLS